MNREKLKFPNLRDELKVFLRELSDINYQRQYWGSNSDQGSCLDFSIHFLFDDTPLSEDAESCIGLFLFNKDEAKAITRVVEAIDNVFKIYGTDLDDLGYVEKPEWISVVSFAGEALSEIR